MARANTARREKFCQEYLVDLNQTQAAIRAGFSKKSAKAEGSRLMTLDSVKERIAELQAERSKRTEITQDSVIADLEAVKEKAMAAKQFPAAVRAIELQGRHAGMWENKAGNKLADSLAELIARTPEKRR